MADHNLIEARLRRVEAENKGLRLALESIQEIAARWLQTTDPNRGGVWNVETPATRDPDSGRPSLVEPAAPIHFENDWK